jgi:hypothetical protein
MCVNAHDILKALLRITSHSNTTCKPYSTIWPNPPHKLLMPMAVDDCPPESMVRDMPRYYIAAVARAKRLGIHVEDVLGLNQNAKMTP